MTIVNTTHGPVVGTRDDTVFSFLGIPFAAPPVGAAAFGPPLPVERWTGTRDTSRFGQVCHQVPLLPPFDQLFASPGPAGDDCLSLNVWTPDPGSAKLPVMVWIHGGAFVAGSGSDPWFQADTFARHGIVGVSINYRLGPYGYLHMAELFDDLGAVTSPGMLDQIAALEWVQSNIANFGGDPERVTLFGNSAGGMSIGALMASPAASGRFKRVICQSGAAHHALPREVSGRLTRRFLEIIDIAPGDTDGLLSVSPGRILEAGGQLVVEAAGDRADDLMGDFAGNIMPFEPMVDGVILPEQPIDAIRAGSAPDIDVLSGSNLDEWRLLSGYSPEFFAVEEDTVVANTERLMQGTGNSGRTVFDTYRDNRPGAAPEEVRDALETDRYYRIPAIRLAEAQQTGSGCVYMYRLSWKSPGLVEGGIGACHTLEIPFVFDKLDTRLATLLAGEEPPAELAAVMHRSWVEFARTGNPGHAGLPEWPEYEPDRRATMDFDVESLLVEAPADTERALWDGVR
jgi:para-nitrobenzyl esterase